MIDYEVIQKIEVLNEVGAGVVADFYNQLIKMNIDIEDRENLLVMLYWQTVTLKDSIIDKNSIEELKDVQAQLSFVNKYIEKLGACRL